MTSPAKTPPATAPGGPRDRRGLWGAVALVAVVLALVLRFVLAPEPNEVDLVPLRVLPGKAAEASPPPPAFDSLGIAPATVEPEPLVSDVEEDAADPRPDAAAAPATLRVVDTAGRPIADPVVYPSGQQPTRWGRRVGHGLVELPGRDTWPPDPLAAPAPMDPLALEVGAKGYRRERIDVHSAGPWPQQVVLQGATTLDVRLELRPDMSREDMFLTVSCRGSLYEDGEDGDPHVFTYRELLSERSSSPLVGASSDSHMLTGDGDMTLFMHRSSTTYHLVGVRPGKEIEVVATGPGGSQLVDETVVLAPGEHRVLTLAIDASSHSLEGIVTDLAGVPLEGVDVQLRPDNGLPTTWATARTDADGRYRFRALTCRRPFVAVVHPGFARHEAQPDLERSEVLDVALRPAPDFVLEVRQDRSLRPVREARVTDRWADWSFAWRQTAPGDFAPQYLPDRAVDMQVFHRGSTYTVAYEPGDSRARLLIPETGDVIVLGLVVLPEDDREQPRVRLRRADQDEWLAAERTRGQPTLTLAELPPGDYIVEQYLYRTEGAVVLAAGAVTVPAGGTVHVVLEGVP